MIRTKKIIFDKEYDVLQLSREDILSQDLPFKANFKSSFTELFGKILFSSTKFHLYIYKVYKKEDRGYYLAKWIFDKFIDLLVEDLIFENDTFQFPRKDIKLSVKDANEFRKDWKRYVPSSYGRDYRLFIQKPGRQFFCRLAKPYFKLIVEQGKKQPYL